MGNPWAPAPYELDEFLHPVRRLLRQIRRAHADRGVFLFHPLGPPECPRLVRVHAGKNRAQRRAAQRGRGAAAGWVRRGTRVDSGAGYR